jgi:ribonuclease R
MFSQETLLEFMREKAYKPMNIHELMEAFDVREPDAQETFIHLLNEMEDQGFVVRTRTHRYGVPEKMNLVVGRLQGKAKGFGFVLPEREEDKELGDIYIHAGDMNGAMHGDRVICRIQKKVNGARREGAIIRILERATKTVVGTYSGHQYYGFVTPDDRRIGFDIFVYDKDRNGAEDGQKVVVEIIHYPEGWRSPQGKVVEILGRPDDPGVDILSVIRKYGLPEEFPADVLEEAERVPESISEEEIKGRRDLRNITIVTIDGEDAKDLDDAVSVQRLENGNYLLGVHIADVSYYVKEGTALDREAFNRGTSVYLVDRVIPMLPPRLSNGICSLNPKVDRLTMTCEMEWSPHAELVRHDIYPSVIRTKERMTYTNVRKILVDQDPELMDRYADLVDVFRLMEELAMKLRKRRMKRGAIDFEFEEAKIIVDEKGQPVEIKKRERSIAEQIIEEFMLAANETIAEHFYWMNVPFLYRIHEEPDSERMQDFAEFVYNFGYTLKGIGNHVHPHTLQNLLEKIKGKPEERIISTIMLRSMRQAKYAAEPLGHFGLAAQYYSHFTSPIRRYPDLQIHRIIREILVDGGLSPERMEQLRANMPEVAQHTSERERMAVEAERETDVLKKVEFMEQHVGEEFEGIISGVTSFGLFVELDNTIEGMIHVSYLDDDYYQYNEKHYALIGERTGRTFRIGDIVRVKVEGVNKEERTIDFRLLKGGTRLGRKITRADRKANGKHEREEKRKKEGRGLVTVAKRAQKKKKKKR